MKSKTRLDSAVFQLTPTRTRCDLLIIANGKTEKIASGLTSPFLAHLKTAQDQFAKGGYSITLEPSPDSETSWFTKGTLERFVRFVSTPEVLKRVNTIESEIFQIEESIAIQNNESLGLSTQDAHQNKVEDHQTRQWESTEGTKPLHDNDTEKAIVLYKPEAHPPESNGSTRVEENSKVQLLKVLEVRKAVLQKEQGMAFARAVAAGFEMDHIVHLISFGESFGATHLVEACLRYVQLWKVKHETGQWLEIDSAETISGRSDFSSMISPGNAISIETQKPNDIREVWPESNSQLSNEFNGKASNDTSAEQRPPLDAQLPGNQEYFQGQYQHPMFHQWPIHSPSGAPPVFQPYPMHAMPYYQNYPGSGPFFQPPYSPMEDPRLNTQKVGLRRQSMDGKDSNTESESGELGPSKMRSQDASELENECPQGREPRRKAKKQSGMVVIRNINYITSKKKSSSGSESGSTSDPETDDDSEGSRCDTREMKHKNYRSSKIGAKYSSSTNISNSYGKDDGIYGQEADGENWQAFQKFLLKNDDKNTHNNDRDMFSMEKEAQVTRRKNTTGPDPIVPRGHDLNGDHDGRMIDLDTNSNKATRMLKASSEELMASGRDVGEEYSESQMTVQLTELGGRGGYRRVTNDEFMIHKRENQLGFMNSCSDPLAGNELGHASDNWDMRSSHNVIDESFVVPLRTGVHDQIGTESRTAPDMDVEFPSGLQNTEDSSSRVRSQVSYEPEDLSFIPERGTERESIGYDPAIDYEMQVQADDAGRLQNTKQGDAVTDVKEGETKLVKDKKFKGQDSLEKRKAEASAKKVKPSKLSPSTEAQARAAKLRAFKADLQKIKKEKEEEEIKRLEALKRERQKRIAGRGNSSPAQSQLTSQMKPRLPTKLSPNSHGGSKFSDSEPGSSSPIQRLPTRTVSMGLNESEKVFKHSRLNNSGHLAVNGLSRSVSSLPELKKEKDVITAESKASTARIRRLSEPKKSTIHHAASVKLRSTDPVSKSRVSDGPEIKKISEIMTLDRTKAATLPELKIRTPKEPSNMIQNKSAAKEVTQKANGTKPSLTSGSSKLKKNNENTSHDSNGDDNLIIEKAVVMQRSEERTEIRKASYEEDKAGAKPELVLEYAAIHAPVSPEPMGEVALPGECRFNQPSFHEVKADHAATELPNISSISIVENPYQAPYARVSSIEDPSRTKLEYTNVPKENKAAITKETVNAQVSDTRDLNSLEESLESLGKTQGKEPSKGFKRLLKFGRKNASSSAGERIVESDKLSTNGSLGDDHSASPAPYEVHTLKNLIAQDETPTSGTSHKASRHFSLLSPFRSKTSEKKLTT